MVSIVKQYYFDTTKQPKHNNRNCPIWMKLFHRIVFDLEKKRWKKKKETLKSFKIHFILLIFFCIVCELLVSVVFYRLLIDWVIAVESLRSERDKRVCLSRIAVNIYFVLLTPGVVDRNDTIDHFCLILQPISWLSFIRTHIRYTKHSTQYTLTSICELWSYKDDTPSQGYKWMKHD